MKYSIDMVRFRCRFSKQFLSEFFDMENVNSIFFTEPNISGWVDSDFKGFRYNFRVMDSSGAGLWIGFIHNSESVHSKSTNLYVEYNPNKFNLLDSVIPDRVRRLLGYIARYGELVLIHLAIDIFEGIVNFLIDKRYKVNYKLFITNKGITHYVGEYGHGYLKVYDKGREQDVNYDWTRVEYVIRYDCSVDSIHPLDFSCFPRVYRIRNNLLMSPVVKALIYSINDGVISLHDLSRTYKKKVINECELITIDAKRVNDLVVGLIKDLRGLS